MLFFLISLYLAPRLAPRNIILQITGSRSLLLSWDHLSKNDTNGIIINYSVCIQLGANTPICVNISATNDRYPASGLKPYSNYTVKIAAINSAGFGPYNVGITKQTNEEGKYFVYTYHKILYFELFTYNQYDVMRNSASFVVTSSFKLCRALGGLVYLLLVG